MTRNRTKSEQEPSIFGLLKEYKNIESEIGSTPTLAQLEKHGVYSADEFRAAFGSHSALVEAAQQPRNLIIVAIRQERSKRGHTPKLSEIRESKRETIPDVREYYDSWKEALEAAGVLPTADEIIEAIQREQTNLGSIPSHSDFLNRTKFRQVDYLNHFESWDDALSAAGFSVNKDELHSEIRQVTDELEKTPTLAEFKEFAPSAHEQYQRSDRLWMETLDDAGVLPSSDEIIREIIRVAEELDRRPSAGEFTDRTNIRSAVYQHHFDNWITALDAAGLLPTKNDLMDHIRSLSDEVEPILERSNLIEKSKYSKSVYDYHFDSWKEAITSAGILPSKEQLTSQIRAVSEATESIPSRKVVVERGDHGAQAYEFQFSSWEKALEAAGVLPSQADFLSLVRSADSGNGWVDQDAVYGEDALPSDYHTRFFDSWEDTLRSAGVSPSRGEFLELVRCENENSLRLDEQEFYRTSELPTGYHSQLFESWHEVLETAGISPTKDEFLSIVHDAKADQNWVDKDQMYGQTGLPSDYHTLFFESWEETLEAASVLIDEQQFLSMLRCTEPENGWIKQRNFYAESDLPSDYHTRFFESWVEALDAAGILPASEDILQHLRALESDLGDVPSRSEAIASGKYRANIYRHRFSSWKETLDAAGLLPSKEELLVQIRDLNDDLGHIPSKSDVAESGKHQLDIYRFRFGSYEQALEAAGLLNEELLIAQVKQVAADQGPIVSPDDVYDATGLPKDYHDRIFDSWKQVLKAAGVLDGTLPGPIEERLQELATDWGRPPSEEYARRHLAIKTTITEHDGPRITRNWNKMVEAAGLDPDDIDTTADIVKEIEQLAGTLEHRPNRTEVREYLIEESNYRANRWEIDDAIQQAAIPDERDLTPTHSLTRQRYEKNSGDIPSHTDLLAELNIIRSRTKSDKDSIESGFQSRGVIDERHYTIQFGSVSEAIDQLLTIDTKRFREPIERNFSLTPGILKDSVKELGEILERPPLLEEAVSLGEASMSDFVETFDSWGAVTDGQSTSTSWSNEELLDDVENVGRNLGKPPTHEELLEFGTVPVQCLLRRFGSWPRVLGLVGVDVDMIPEDYLGYEFTSELWNTTDYIVREEFGQEYALLDELHRLRFELDRVPSEKLIEQFSPYAPEKFTGAFGSITAAVERTGITEPETTTSPTTPSPEEFLRELQSVAEAATTWVLPQDISLHSEYSVGTYIGTFGSFESALEQAKLPTDHLVGPTETYGDAWHAEHQMKAGILRAIADLASRDKDNVTMARLQTVSGISQNVVYRFFDNWDEAREAARVRKSLGTVEVNPDDVENPDFVDDLLSEMDEMMEDY